MKRVDIYPDNALDKLEWPKIQSLLRQFCHSSLGIGFVDKMKLITDPGLIERSLNQVAEFLTLIQSENNFPDSHFFDLNESLNYLEINNSVLSEEQFLNIALFLQTIRAIFQYFQSRDEKYPELNLLLKGEKFDPRVLHAVSSVISEEGAVRSGVSEELDRIRKEIRHTERELDKKFNSILQQALINEWLAPGGESIKNARRVLTVVSEHKRKIKGIIHDESATGKTVFIEPEQTIEISNNLTEARLAERREIFRILRQLSDAVRPEVAILRKYQRLAGVFDFIRAKALLAHKIRGAKPSVRAVPVLKLNKAYHPVLLLHNLSMNRKTVPVDIEINVEDRILVISGPNAGGKSVALKTIGLLQVMFQFGLLVPVHPDSEMGIFTEFFVGLGDEQSIENDLSTYSSHLVLMKYFTENAGPLSMILIDEFGTGTDPKFGGPIAESILEVFNRKLAKGVITTHYSNLKLFATETPGIINGSMLFDFEKMTPLYILKSGQPGSSQAFEIAEKVGLSLEIIESARSRMEKEYLNFDSLLATMETEKHLLNLNRTAAESERLELDKLIATYASLKNDLEKNKQKILLDSKSNALRQLEESNKKLERMLKELKEAEKPADQAARIRKTIQKEKSDLSSDIQTLKAKKLAEKPKLEIKAGSLVKVGEGTENGFVEEIRNNKALVAFGNVRTLVKVEDLVPVDIKEDKNNQRFRGIDFAKASSEFSPTIDVRGKRVDEALQIIENQLDKAMLLNFPAFRILHGKGDGILRKSIRSLLSKYDIVKDYRSESPDFGGDGVTLVDLK